MMFTELPLSFRDAFFTPRPHLRGGEIPAAQTDKSDNGADEYMQRFIVGSFLHEGHTRIVRSAQPRLSAARGW